MEEVVSFGDSGNDICMLTQSGMSIVPSNCSYEVKKIAKKISTWSNDEDFIKKELELIIDSSINLSKSNNLMNNYIFFLYFNSFFYKNKINKVIMINNDNILKDLSNN